MARDETAGRPVGQLPARRPMVIGNGFVPGRRVQAQARNHRISVSVPGVNRDPFPFSMAAKRSQIRRTHGRTDQTSRGEGEGNRAGAIVAPIDKRMMSAAITVRFFSKLVTSPDRPFDRQRRLGRGAGHAKNKTRFRAGHGWTGDWKWPRQQGRNSQPNKNSGDKQPRSRTAIHMALISASAIPGVAGVAGKNRRKPFFGSKNKTSPLFLLTKEWAVNPKSEAAPRR